MKCPRCQHANHPVAKFCEECAAPLARACTNCGAQLSPTAKFCSECAHPTGSASTSPTTPRFTAPGTYTPKHLAERILNSKAALEGERKQVTILFADLKGSMELLADRDPEEARKLLDPVLEHMMEAVHRYEGTVNQVMGDGIMALFGAPLAHEDHAVRACYAALRMQALVKSYADGVYRTHGVPVRIRVGLNSGEVVVRSIGSDLHMDYTAVGQATHLAARMEQIADPGTIRLTANTLRSAQGFVQVQALGPTPVKGLAVPVEVFELTGASPARSRLQAMAARGLTRFVGREVEVATVFTALDEARAGRGQVVAIVGEPGVGKSRLVWEFTHSPRMDGCLVLEAPSVSYGQPTPYLPVIDLLKRYAGIEARDDGRKIRDKITGKLLSLDRALQPCLSPLVSLLDGPVDDADWARLDPAPRRQRLHDAIRRVVLREAREQPVVLVFEDLHWSDGETQAALDGLVESLPAARVCLLVNYRPEYRHGWGGKTYYRQLRLDALPPAGATELLNAVLGTDTSVRPLVRGLIARTEGNPFFLEEMVKALAETGALTGERGAYRLLRTPEGPEIPATAQAIVAARIDRLDADDKGLLQAASVLGKDVAVNLLETIADMPADTLRLCLERLQAAEFLYETQLFPEAEYTFKHALTHDVAYAGLLLDRRRALHATVAGAMERLYGDRLVEHVERLARHASRGEIWDKAARYSRQAGSKASLRSANREAVNYFEQALDALQHLPRHPETIAESVDVRSELLTALEPLGETERIRAVLDDAQAMAEAIDDQSRLGRTLTYRMVLLARYGQLAAASEVGHRALTIGQAQSDIALQVVANSYLGRLYVVSGECREAIRFSEAALALIPDDVPGERFGQAVIQGSFVRNTLARALGALGRFAEAFEQLREATHIAEEAAHVYSLLRPLFTSGALKVDQGDFVGALVPLERGRDLCRTGEVSNLLPDFAGALGAAYHRTGRRAEGIALMEEASWSFAGKAASVAGWAGRVGALGAAYLADGRLADATRITQEGLAVARHRGEREVEAQLVRLLGDIAAYPDRLEVDVADSHYRQALALAEQLGLRPLVAHCHLGLGKLYRRAGKWGPAEEHVAIATAMYREMEMTYWLETIRREVEAPGDDV